jgi:hypothetical protein
MFGAVNRVRARSLGAAIDTGQGNRASKMEDARQGSGPISRSRCMNSVWSSSPTTRVISDLQSCAAARAATTTASPEGGLSRRCVDEFKGLGSAACAVSDGTLLSIQKGQVSDASKFPQQHVRRDRSVLVRAKSDFWTSQGRLIGASQPVAEATPRALDRPRLGQRTCQLHQPPGSWVQVAGTSVLATTYRPVRADARCDDRPSEQRRAIDP